MDRCVSTFRTRGCHQRLAMLNIRHPYCGVARCQLRTVPSTLSSGPTRTLAIPATSSTSIGDIATTIGGIQYREDLSRKTSDPLPPRGNKVTGLVQLGEGLWCLRQDFFLTENIFINTFIVRLRSGGLMMINPTARTEEAEALLDSVPGGTRAVEHVVIANLSPEHWFHAADWAPWCAESGRAATLWVPPGLLEGRATAGLLGGPEKVRQMRASYGTVAVLPDQAGPLPGLEEEAAAVTFHETWGFYTETTLRLHDYDATLFTDMAFAAFEHPTPVYGDWGTKIAGIHQKLGCPFGYPMLLKDRPAAAAWVAAVEAWGSDTLLCSHLDPLVRNGRTELQQCYSFLREGRQ